MSQYHHLTISEREKILYFRAKGKSISFIANKLGRSISTISRELKRNSFNGEYWPDQAEKAYFIRRQKCHSHRRLEDPSLFLLYVVPFWNGNGLHNRLPNVFALNMQSV